MIKSQWAIGIDLGGSMIEMALVNSSGLLHDLFMCQPKANRDIRQFLNESQKPFTRHLKQRQKTWKFCLPNYIMILVSLTLLLLHYTA